MIMSPATITLIILIVMLILLGREIVPLGVMGIALPFIVVAFRLVEAKVAIGYFVTKTVVLVPCVYILGNALFKVGIADSVGNIIKKFSNKCSKGEWFTVLLVMLSSAVGCMLLPRYGVTGALMPIVVAVARSTGISRTKLLLALPLASNIWGNNTLLSTPPNMLANGFLEQVGAPTFGFFEFALIGVPIGIAGTVAVVLFNKLMPARINEKMMYEQEDGKTDGRQSANVPKWKVVATYTIFAAFLLSIIFEKRIGVPFHITAMTCSALVIICGIATEKECYSCVSWGIVWFLGGIQAFAKAMETSGAGEIVASLALKLLGTVDGSIPNVFLITAIMFGISAIMTQFMSNTGAAGILFTIGISVASTIGADPRPVLMAITMGCGAAFMTPMATPCNAMVMEQGNILFNDYLRVGVPLMLTTGIVCTIGIPLIWPYF